jgi:molybdopterin converting factor small subunit
MNLLVHLHTILQRRTPQGMVSKLDVSLPVGSTLADLLSHLEIKLSPEALLLVVNGHMAELNDVLQDGDQVNLMPAISGG